MSTLIDLTNQRFGKWLVLKRVENGSGGRAQWLCRCDCGTEKIVLGKTLRNGTSTSCGCNRSKSRINLIGERFGNLTVVAQTENKANGRTAWLCKCDCGNQKVVGTKELRNGDTRSCGCLRDKLLSVDETGKTYGKLTVISKVENYETNIPGTHWLCKCECGNEIIVLGKRLRNGHTQSCGCLNSKGEALISQILKDNNYDFKTQYCFSDCLTENNYPCKFDFAIFENNSLKCLIEYDGIQHFEESNWNLEKNQYRDEIKNNYCIDNHIPLIRISYLDYDKIDINYLIKRMEEINV